MPFLSGLSTLSFIRKSLEGQRATVVTPSLLHLHSAYQYAPPPSVEPSSAALVSLCHIGELDLMPSQTKPIQRRSRNLSALPTQR
jgi:hypothetical protein